MKNLAKLISLTTIAPVVLLSACTPKPGADQVAASQASESAAMSMTAAEAASQAVAEAMTSVDATGYVALPGTHTKWVRAMSANGQGRKARP